MFCSKCGKEIFDEAVICPHCGVPVKNVAPIVEAQPAETAEQKELKAKKRAKLFGTLSISFIFAVLLFMFSGISTIGESAYELYDEDQFVAAWVFSWWRLLLGLPASYSPASKKILWLSIFRRLYLSARFLVSSILCFSKKPITAKTRKKFGSFLFFLGLSLDKRKKFVYNIGKRRATVKNRSEKI